MRKEKSGAVGLLASVALFAVMLAVLATGTMRIAGSATNEGLAATRDAIERAAVLCYAAEGFYPPGLAYLEAHYGVQIDHSRYVVEYRVFATNVAPTIRVLAKGSEG
jgi:hypothetical protein